MGFSKDERLQFRDFKIINKEETYYELESESTKHRWIIKKQYGVEKKPIGIYHKHTADTPYYHRHGYATNVSMAIKKIKAHDDYVVNKDKGIMMTGVGGAHEATNRLSDHFHHEMF